MRLRHWSLQFPSYDDDDDDDDDGDDDDDNDDGEGDDYDDFLTLSVPRSYTAVPSQLMKYKCHPRPYRQQT